MGGKNTTSNTIPLQDISLIRSPSHRVQSEMSSFHQQASFNFALEWTAAATAFSDPKTT